MKHGLVIGKFYPPHAGHHLLIRTAASACDAVTVIVMAADHESIPLATRIRWLQEEHASEANVVVTGIEDNLRMDLDDPEIWAGHVEIMKRALARIGAKPVSAVFSSETYGAELARRFGALPVMVDVGRTLAPISATQVRADLVANWHHLAPAVRAGMAVRVVVVGAESSGTTTLAAALTDHWRTLGGAHGLTRCVPEYGRAYTAQKWANARAAAQVEGRRPPAMEELEWKSAEFEHIARSQIAAEELAARTGGPLLVCDTDAFATAIWHERYMGRPSDEVMRLADSVHHALYLVTDHADVPFEQDGLRDGETIRPWMTQRFIAALQEARRPYVVLAGSRDDRLEQAIRATSNVLENAWRLAAP